MSHFIKSLEGSKPSGAGIGITAFQQAPVLPPSYGSKPALLPVLSLCHSISLCFLPYGTYLTVVDGSC